MGSSTLTKYNGVCVCVMDLNTLWMSCRPHTVEPSRTGRSRTHTLNTF